MTLEIAFVGVGVVLGALLLRLPPRGRTSLLVAAMPLGGVALLQLFC